MAEIPTFDAKAPRKGNLDVSGIGTGAAETWEALARGAGQIAARLGSMADKKAAVESDKLARTEAAALPMPGVEFVFEPGTSGGPVSQRAPLPPVRQAGDLRGRTRMPKGGSVADILRAAAKRYGEDGEILVQIGDIESKLKPNAKNPNSSAGGVLQFIDGTAKDYGLANRFDPAQAADKLAAMLPAAVDAATPDGTLPEAPKV